MSDGPSIRDHRITKTNFRSCSTDESRSQAPFYLCALNLIANQAEGTFVLLRYILGGDRPSQTAQLTLSAARIHGSALELKHIQGGISRLPPYNLAAALHRLPPILHSYSLVPLQSCSKGARGLSV